MRKKIYKYVAIHDSTDNAEKLLTGIEERIKSLKDHPERGDHPPELLHIGLKAYREIHFKPYRIICQIIKNNVFVHCVLDGRRDLMSLLQERLLR